MQRAKQYSSKVRTIPPKKLHPPNSPRSSDFFTSLTCFWNGRGEHSPPLKLNYLAAQVLWGFWNGFPVRSRPLIFVTIDGERRVCSHERGFMQMHRISLQSTIIG